MTGSGSSYLLSTPPYSVPTNLVGCRAREGERGGGIRQKKMSVSYAKRMLKCNNYFKIIVKSHLLIEC